MRRVPTRYLDDYDMPVEIEKDKMGRITRTVCVPHDGIYLKRARPAIGRIVLVYLPPRTKSAERNDKHYHRQHTYDNCQQWHALAMKPSPAQGRRNSL